jgi:hypothetical protein
LAFGKPYCPVIHPKMILHRQNFPAGGLELLQVRPGLGLDVAADERFGAAGAEGDPFPARQEKFVSVGVMNFSTGNAPMFFSPPPSLCIESFSANLVKIGSLCVNKLLLDKKANS